MISLRPPLQGIDQRRAHRAKIERSQSPAVRRLHERLIFWAGKKQLVLTIRVIIQHLNSANLAARGQSISGSFGANQISPKFGSQVGSIKAAKDAMPVGII